MDSHLRPRTATFSTKLSNKTYQEQIPWWSDISPAILTALALEITPTALTSRSFDVVVIGAGIAGLSAALSARATGAEVLLLDKERILGYGATGRNAGILSAGINMGLSDLPSSSPERAFWPVTTKILLELIAAAEQPNSLLTARLTGSISLAETKHAAYKLEREAHTRVEAGLKAELRTPAQVAEATEGRLQVQSVLSAMWLPHEGRIHPLSLLAHLAQQAHHANIQLVGQAYIISHEEITDGNNRRYWQITLADGSFIKANSIIRTVGPTVQPNSRIYALTFAIDLPDNFPLFWDASPYTYTDYRPGNGRLGVSGGRYGKAGAIRHDTHYFKRLADGARKWLPELAKQEPSFTWAVDLHVAAHMLPQLHRLGNNAPGIAIEGLGALGILPGIALGRRAGKLVTGQL